MSSASKTHRFVIFLSMWVLLSMMFGVALAEESAKIENVLKARDTAAPGSTFTYGVYVRNTGSVTLHLDVAVNIQNPSGTVVYDSHINETHALYLDPGQTGVPSPFNYTVPNDAVTGIYKIIIGVHSSDWMREYDYWGVQGYHVADTVQVVIPEYSFLVLPLFMLTTLLAVIIYKNRNRKASSCTL
jgi:uncharacterized repeat protein (TIGR01451 family)